MPGCYSRGLSWLRDHKQSFIISAPRMNRRVIRGVLLWARLGSMGLDGGAILLRLRDEARKLRVNRNCSAGYLMCKTLQFVKRPFTEFRKDEELESPYKNDSLCTVVPFNDHYFRLDFFKLKLDINKVSRTSNERLCLLSLLHSPRVFRSLKIIDHIIMV